MRLFITGGSGYLGKHLIKHYYNKADITIFSRDEAKQFLIKQQYPDVKCVLGDVRNYDSLLRAMRQYWPTHAVFAASMKHIDACRDNYQEANDIIVKGAFNSRQAAEECGVDAACFISSDKSRAATTIYGSMKYTAGEAFITNPTDMKVNTLVYGNVMNSTGSIIPKIWETIRSNTNSYGRYLSLYHSDMTRFLYDIKDAVSLIDYALSPEAPNGTTMVPYIKSFKIIDLFNLYTQQFGLTWNLSSPRPGEKLHEILISKEEWARTTEDPYRSLYFIHNDFQNKLNFDTDFSSRDYCISKTELKMYLEQNGWFK